MSEMGHLRRFSRFSARSDLPLTADTLANAGLRKGRQSKLELLATDYFSVVRT